MNLRPMSSEQKQLWQVNFERMIEYLHDTQNIESLRSSFKSLIDNSNESSREAKKEKVSNKLRAIALDCQLIYSNLNDLKIEGKENTLLAEAEVQYAFEIFENLVQVQSEKYPKSLSELVSLVLNLSYQFEILRNHFMNSINEFSCVIQDFLVINHRNNLKQIMPVKDIFRYSNEISEDEQYDFEFNFQYVSFQCISILEKLNDGYDYDAISLKDLTDSIGKLKGSKGILDKTAINDVKIFRKKAEKVFEFMRKKGKILI